MTGVDARASAFGRSLPPSGWDAPGGESDAGRSTRRLRALDALALVVLVLGGLERGLAGLLGIDLIAIALGPASNLARAFHGLVGAAAIYTLWLLAALRR